MGMIYMKFQVNTVFIHTWDRDSSDKPFKISMDPGWDLVNLVRNPQSVSKYTEI